MAYRVRGKDVAELVNTNISPEIIEKYIKTANIVIAETMTSASYSEDLLTEMELYLAAHFLALRSPELRIQAQEGTTYMAKAGVGLQATIWGQQVVVLDKDGLLSGGEGSVKLARIEALA